MELGELDREVEEVEILGVELQEVLLGKEMVGVALVEDGAVVGGREVIGLNVEAWGVL